MNKIAQISFIPILLLLILLGVVLTQFNVIDVGNEATEVRYDFSLIANDIEYSDYFTYDESSNHLTFNTYNNSNVTRIDMLTMNTNLEEMSTNMSNISEYILTLYFSGEHEHISELFEERIYQTNITLGFNDSNLQYNFNAYHNDDLELTTDLNNEQNTYEILSLDDEYKIELDVNADSDDVFLSFYKNNILVESTLYEYNSDMNAKNSLENFYIEIQNVSENSTLTFEELELLVFK